MRTIKAKVYWNRKNGQGRVHLPKREFEICPREVEIKVPRLFMKKKFFKRGK